MVVTGCSPETQTTSPTSARFAGMANSDSAETREGEEHYVLIEGDGYPYTITDYLGYRTVLEKRPERVAVLSGTFIGMWYNFGGTSICRTDLGSCKLDEAFAAEIESLPSVGAVYNANAEAVIEQQPDFIIAQAGTQSTLCNTLRQAGFKVVVLHMRTYEQVVDHMQVFGKLLDQEDTVEEYIRDMDNRKAAIVAQLPAETKSVVILYVTSSKLSVKLNNSIAGDIAGILKLRNIAADLPPDTLGSESTPLDIEYIVEKNPDIVLVTSMIASNEQARQTMEKEFSTNPAWSGVQAIKKGNVVYLPQEYFLYNAGHNYMEAIEYMARGVYPDIYGALEN